MGAYDSGNGRVASQWFHAQGRLDCCAWIYTILQGR